MLFITQLMLLKAKHDFHCLHHLHKTSFINILFNLVCNKPALFYVNVVEKTIFDKV